MMLVLVLVVVLAMGAGVGVLVGARHLTARLGGCTTSHGAKPVGQS